MISSATGDGSFTFLFCESEKSYTICCCICCITAIARQNCSQMLLQALRSSCSSWWLEASFNFLGTCRTILLGSRSSQANLYLPKHSSLVELPWMYGFFVNGNDEVYFQAFDWSQVRDYDNSNVITDNYSKTKRITVYRRITLEKEREFRERKRWIWERG